MSRDVQIRQADLFQVGLAGVTFPLSQRRTIQPAQQTWPPEWITFDPEPICEHVPIRIWIIIDDSGSVTAWTGQDPLGHRYDEIELTLHRLTDRCRRCRSNDAVRVAVRHFDPGRYDCDLTPLNKRGLPALNATLTIPPGGTGSVLGPSLTVAEREARDFIDGRNVLIVASDFALFDNDPGATIATMAGFPGDAHAMVLGGGIPDLLRDVDGVAAHAVQWDSRPGEIAKIIHRAVLGLSRSDR